MNYRTLKEKIEFEGIGIHSGKKCKILLEPSERFSGVNFYVNNTKIPAKVDYVINTSRATALGLKDKKVSTVEHLLSAMYAFYITDVNIKFLLGEEVPTYDSSARVFVEKFLKSDFEILQEVKEINFDVTFNFEINNSKYEIQPSDKFEISCELLSKESKFLNGQKIYISFSTEEYVKQIAYAKTYCLLKDVEKIQSSGYGLGGNLENVIVIDNDKVVNSDKLAYSDEPVRHKVLDFIGDFSLLGVYLKTKIKIVNPSHYANFEFCKKIKEFLKT